MKDNQARTQIENQTKNRRRLTNQLAFLVGCLVLRTQSLVCTYQERPRMFTSATPAPQSISLLWELVFSEKCFFFNAAIKTLDLKS